MELFPKVNRDFRDDDLFKFENDFQKGVKNGLKKYYDFQKELKI